MIGNVTLFPNILQPATAMKAYAPIGVKFWENQETTLESWKEFADGWFARRQKSAQAALEAAKHIGDADTPSDIFREYQNWFTRSMELLAEDGKAYQQQVLSAGARLSAQGRKRDRPASVARANATEPPRRNEHWRGVEAPAANPRPR
jgi:hypothetical protein